MIKTWIRIAVTFLVFPMIPHLSLADPGRDEVSLNGEWQSALAESLDTLPGDIEWQPANVPGSFQSTRGEKRWFRWQFDAPKEWAGRRIYIVYDGVKFDSRHFVNRKHVGNHFRGYDRFQIDATPGIEFGAKNELLVGCSDWQSTFEKPVDMTDKPGGHTARYYPKNVGLTPIGGRFYAYGVWGDVKLVAVSPVHISDVTIRTSVRKSLLEVDVEVNNASGVEVAADVDGCVVEEPEISLDKRELRLKPGERKTVCWQIPWDGPRLWTYDDPYLYYLQTRLNVAGKPSDSTRTRFGFREFWCEGRYFYLNGTRLLLRSSSMWPLGAADKSAAAERLQRMRDNINIICFRTHTQPWRQCWYDAADEVGMLMIPEGPVFNDDYLYKLEDQRFWDNYAAELHSMTRRFKNNPSVVIFSLENEFWGGRMNDTSPYKPQLVHLGELMRKWDPTRPFMYESDGDPGGVADIIGIHYPWEMGKNYLYPNGCYWMDTPTKASHWFTNGEEMWKWDRKKPLYIGEYLWSPCPTPKRYTTFFGDEAYHDYRKYHNAAIGLAWSFQTRVYRYYRVSGLCPWTCAGGSLDVTKDPMAAGQAESMRPLAAFVKEYTARFYAGHTVKRTLHVINDTLYDGLVKVSWDFAVEGHARQQGEVDFTMRPADLRIEQFGITMPTVAEPTKAMLTVRATMAKAPDFEDIMAYEVHPPLQTYQPRVPLAVLGSHALKALRSAGIKANEVTDLGKIGDDVGILVIGKDALPPAQNEGPKGLHIRPIGWTHQALRQYVQRGGRVLLMAQTKPHDPIGNVAFTPRQATMVFPLARRHPILKGLTKNDLKFWMPEHFVADAQVERIGCGGQPICVSGGDVGIEFSPLAECRVGNGLLIACGLRVLEALDEEPVAGRLLNNLLEYMDGWSADTRDCVILPEDSDFARKLARMRLALRAVAADAALSVHQTCLIACADDPGAAVMDRIVESYVKPGGRLWWHRPDAEALTRLMKRLGVKGSLVTAAGPVRLDWDDPFVDGLAQADLWWPGEQRRGAPGWAMRPLDPAIIDCEVGIAREVDPDQAKAFSCLDFKITGSQWNKAQEEFAILASTGSVIGIVDFGKGGPMLLGLRGKGSVCDKIWPRIEVRVDGELIGHVNVMSDVPASYALFGHFAGGRHEVELRFVNDRRNLEMQEDRNVFLSHIYVQPVDEPRRTFKNHASPAALVSIPVEKGVILIDTIKWDDPGVHGAKAHAFATSLLIKLGAHPSSFALAAMEAENMELEEVGHNSIGKTEVTLANVGSVRTTITADMPGDYDLRICGRGRAALEEWPVLVVRIDEREVGRITLDSVATAPFALPITLTQGEHKLEMRFINDYCDPGKADRNCYLDKVEIWPRQ